MTWNFILSKYLVQTVKATVFLFALPATALMAETNLRVFYGRNSGELTFESGNRLKGIVDVNQIAGSRLTYRQDFNLVGIGVERVYSNWRLSASYASSGGYVDSGGAKDQDFPLGMSSKESYSGLDTSKWRYNDSAYVFSGMPSYATANGLSAIDYHDIVGTGRYSLREQDSYRFYLSFAADFSYSKFTFYDALFSATFPVADVYLSIVPGRLIVLYNKKTEVPFGAGLGMQVSESIEAELELLFILGLNRYRFDHRIQGYTIDSYNRGQGMTFNLRLKKRITDNFTLGLNYRNHRFYSRTMNENRVSPGYNKEDIIRWAILNNKSHQKIHLNEKDYRVELFVERRFGF